MPELTGKKALITGATQGIGLAIAKRLSENGSEVFMNGTNEEKAIRTAGYATPSFCWKDTGQ